MKKTLGVFILALAILLLGGQLSSPVQYGFLRHELEDLSTKGMTYRFLDNETVEVKQEWTGLSRVFKTVGPSEAEIRAWADMHGVPILTIDPNTIDTSRFTGWYRYWTQVPVSSSLGTPIVIGDIDRNGRDEIYGTHFDSTNREFETRIYEIDSSGVTTLAWNYGQPRPGQGRLLIDIDKDSLREVTFTSDGLLRDFEQGSMLSLPTSIKFSHQRYQGNSSPGYTGIYFGSLDGDSLTDFLYQGS